MKVQNSWPKIQIQVHENLKIECTTFDQSTSSSGVRNSENEDDPPPISDGQQSQDNGEESNFHTPLTKRKKKEKIPSKVKTMESMLNKLDVMKEEIKKDSVDAFYDMLNADIRE